MLSETEKSAEKFLGKGRSATVYAGIDAEGGLVARKIFVGLTLAGLVHYLFFGADNPYIWSPSAIQEAASRRRIMTLLVQWWFGSRMRVAETKAIAWNQKFRANEMKTELIVGRGVSLHHSFSELREPELRDLVHNIMKPLQSYLIEAGFDGLTWQAGLGNPVALSNFLLEEKADGSTCWVWIDMESGVPALFPANPITFCTFYLPRSIFYGRPLFDDVNVPKLEAYLDKHRDQLTDGLKGDSWDVLCKEIALLGYYQKQWRSMTRLERSIQARFQRGDISSELAKWYQERPLQWYRREIACGVLAGVERLRMWVAKWLNVTTFRRFARGATKFISSARYRTDLAREYIALRIEKWNQRGQLHKLEADYLIKELIESEASVYITDFGVDIAIKPIQSSHVDCASISFWDWCDK